MARHIYNPAEDIPTGSEDDDAFDALWFRECTSCGNFPVVRAVDLCGSCAWGESAMINGAWVDE